MADRRSELADTAIAIVAGEGLRALTHRAVDRAAGVPAGTTSNYFRTRDAVVAAAISRMEQRDLAAWESLGRSLPGSPSELAGMLAAAVVALGERDAAQTRARLILSLDRPDAVAAAHARFVDRVELLLRAVGVTDDPRRRARRIVDFCDGVLVHAVGARRSEPLDEQELAAAMIALIA
ncbi:TetR/AcrR family transcriptional regulator [Microbacterium album]|uniref:HTH tetR-type domain-containing protein n=1 Tax=Microbacterium album TaxID=2053191 RepID=A0A917IE49_9MICO|nr:TetR family transcriptional regulator [Microbacterium album]GGH43961.1 hypothetical protein GCM10010921_18310 [Microbacterium album]